MASKPTKEAKTLLRRKLSELLLLGGRGLSYLGRRVNPPPHQRQFQAWAQDRGDATLRLDYALDPDSVVLDLGGYEGQWASDVVARYCCTVHVFEPVPHFADRIARRFTHNPRVQVHRLGLAEATRDARMSIASDGSSLFRDAADAVDVRLVRAADFLGEHEIHRIDLMKINIEGGEYDLLEHLLAEGWVTRIRDLQVQFHDFVPDAKQRMKAIQQRLAETHELTYQYPFVWENWRLKSGSPSPARA